MTIAFELDAVLDASGLVRTDHEPVTQGQVFELAGLKKRTGAGHGE